MLVHVGRSKPFNPAADLSKIDSNILSNIGEDQNTSTINLQVMRRKNQIDPPIIVQAVFNRPKWRARLPRRLWLRVYPR